MAVSAAEQIPGTDAAALIAGQLRLALAERLNLVPKDRWEFLWLTGFPLFEWSPSEKRWAPRAASLHRNRRGRRSISSNPRRGSERMRSKGYDLVLNGVGAGVGQHSDSQPGAAGARVRASGTERGAAAARFGFFLDALTYGTPPHGGIALGLDRVVALLAGEKSIREVIAFPKTTAAQDLMAEAPSDSRSRSSSKRWESRFERM